MSTKLTAATTTTDSSPTPTSAGFTHVRSCTQRLAEPLSAEDQVVQSAPFVSPTKWHLAHTSWFFEEFILRHLPSYDVFDESFRYLFNSYYEAVGPRNPRAERGLITRPGVAEVSQYRAHVDAAMVALLGTELEPHVRDLVELGLHHEQQHQELLLMDALHVLSKNPFHPAYAPHTLPESTYAAADNGFTEYAGGLVEIGHNGNGFAYDNESPRHHTWLEPFAIANNVVTCGQWLEFIADGGYRTASLWTSDGWAAVAQNNWESPLYWQKKDDVWHQFTLHGLLEVDSSNPVCNVSWFEADAFARWAGHRLPTEAEWEISAVNQQLNQTAALTPYANPRNYFGQVWQWTSSSYNPYPRFHAKAGAVGEYNGKFMVNQYVLRGSACITPVGHDRVSYRNFYPSCSRWPFAGLRLAHYVS